MRKQRLLVFGDLRAEIESVEHHFQQTGGVLDSRHEKTAEAFTEAIATFNPEVIVYDCRFSPLDEQSALRLSRARPLDVPFILVSNGLSEEAAWECLSSGAWSLVTGKPAVGLASAVISALERNRLLEERGTAESALRLSAQHSWDLFETTPIPMWREDFSGVQQFILGLRNRGIEHFRDHFDSHPEVIQQCSALIRVLDVNSACVELFGGGQKKDLRVYLASVFCEESWDVLKEQLVAIGEGKRLLESETTYADLKGRRMQGRLRWWVAKGHEENYSEVFLSLLDSTRRREAEKEIGILAHTVRCISECVTIADMNDNILFVNDAFLKTYGYEEEEILGKSIELVRSPNNPQQSTREILPRTLQGGWRGELLNRRKDGTEFPIQLSTSVIRDEAGRPLATVGISTDITARRKAEEDLFRSRSMLQLILDNIPQRVFWKDLDFRYLGCNQPFAQDAHLKTAADILGRNDFDLSWKDSAALYRADDQAVILTNRPKLSFEEPQRRPDGSTLWLRTSKVPLHDRDGKVIGVLGTYEDITESKRAEEAIRASEEKYRKFFEEDLSGAYLATPEGRLLACNPTFAKIFGFNSVEEALKTNLKSLFPAGPARANFLQMLRNKKKLARHESEMLRKDGQPIYVVENAVGKFDEDGALTEIQGYIFDDTERKKLEEQLRQSQKMEAIGTLAGGVAHDFNNLLTCIMGYCELLMGDIPAGNPMRTDVQEIRDSGERAAVLVRQLLAFSRRQVLQPKILDLNVVIGELEKLVRRLIGEDINLQIIPGEGIGYIKADPGQIEQVIMNLVVNSRDAMPHGGDLILQTSNAEPARAADQGSASAASPFVMLSVRDTGNGMSKEVLSHIFEPFFTTKEGGKGTGLGLSTVYGIIEQSGGSIAVESEPGHGTTFRIYLPQTDEESEEAAPGRTPQELPRGFETILVVEDDEAVQTFTARTLRMLGYAVLEARNGEEALRICGTHKGPIHLLLTDVIMPGISGRALAQKIKEVRPATRTLYVSGYYERAGSELNDAALSGTLLAKPFSAEMLGTTVRNVLDHK
jgi:PAS domain S-box-containing protein